MRTVYHEQLSQLSSQIGEMCGLAAVAMDRATGALLRADLALAERVISGHEQIVAMGARVNENCIALLARQQPVAGDLRAIISTMQMVADVERMDALAVHVAKIARRRDAQCAVPNDVHDCFAEMGRVAVELANKARDVLVSRDPERAKQLHQDDDTMDDLYRHLLTVVMDRDWSHGVPAAVDSALLGRFYERFGDHAVEVGRRVVFQVTGELPAEQEVSTY